MHRRRNLYLIISILVIGAFLVFSRADNESSNKLYDVLKDAATEGTYARTYAGEHQDSLDNSGTETIYYWYGANATDGTAILDKNNVRLGDTCWQMLRTTDTGGVKMIYNGPYDSVNKCSSSRGTHKGLTSSSGSSKNLNSAYQYSDSFTYDESTGQFTLTNPTTATWSNSTYQNLIGKYTCASASNTCTTLYNVNTYHSSTQGYVSPNVIGDVHYSQIGKTAFNISSNSLALVGYMLNAYYKYGSSVVTSWGTVQQPSTPIGQTDYDVTENDATYPFTWDSTNKTWESTMKVHSTSASIKFKVKTAGSYVLNYTVSSESGYDKAYFYKDGTELKNDSGSRSGSITLDNLTTSNVIEVKYSKDSSTSSGSDNVVFSIGTPTGQTIDNRYVFGNSFRYENGNYILQNTIKAEGSDDLTNNHYTCLSTSDTCSELKYIYYKSSSTAYYVTLTDGQKTITDMKNDMLYANDVNRYNSSIKAYIDAWYTQNMTDYTDFLEDVVYCNDRTETNAASNGWNPTGGSLSTYFQFKDYSSNTTLKCNTATDQFTTTNTKAKLKYPVGLATYPEMNLLNNSNIRNTGQAYWLLSPYYYNYTSSYIRYISTSGGFSYSGSSSSYGVRPVISLKPDIEYKAGTGSQVDPYVIKTNPEIITKVHHGTITENATVNPGDNKTVSYSPDYGYELESIKVDGQSVSISTYANSYTFTNITGDHTIEVAYDRPDSLYNTVKNSSSTAAYSGEHQDSLAGDSNRTIYYYTSGTSNNAIFGDFCWKIVRTTDTGGVKLLYNGPKSANNTCTNTGANTQIGTGRYAKDTDTELSPSAVGYMYDFSSDLKAKTPSYERVLNSTTSLFTTSHYYGTSISYSSSAYKLGGTINKTRAASRYTVRSTSTTGTAATAYYITNVNGSTFYYLTLTGGTLLAAANKYYRYGTSYSGTTISNATNLRATTYYSGYANIKNKYYCSGTSSTQTCTPKYALAADNEQIYYISTSSYKFGSSVSYSNGTYTLSGTTDHPDSTHHYTCWTTGTTCANVGYVYFIDAWGNMSYIELNGEANIGALLNKMFWNDSVNVSSSGAKAAIDTWYSNNMTSYTSLLEDAVWCNDRSPANNGDYISSNNGFNPDGGLIYAAPANASYHLQNFRGTVALKGTAYQQKLDCPNERDRFAVGNSKAQLTYPVGLITAQEGYFGTTSVMNSGSSYWTMTPCSIDGGAGRIRRVDDTGDVICDSVVSTTNGFRPAVSLKSGIEYSEGTGTTADPYIVDINPRITTSVSHGTITATTRVNLGDNITISYSPDSGYVLKRIKIDGEDVSISTYASSYTFSNVLDPHTIEVIYERGTATFDTGQNVNAKMKTLANETSMTYSSSDTAITAIKRADSLPNGFTPAAENTVSANNSELPIYIFFDDTDGTMYYYSAADDIYLNTDSSNMFSKLESLADISGFSDVDTSEVKYMMSMFENCTTLPSINALSNWDTSKVTSTYRMFKSCTALTNIGGVSDWDVTSVNTMRNMFGDCTNLANINGTSNWNTSNVTDMRAMFDGCTNLANINGVSNWDTSSVTLMGTMFEGCKSLTSISALSNWNTSRVTSMAYMFSGCSALTNVEGASLWDTSALTSISSMFDGCTNLANINGVSDWDTSKVTGMNTAFRDCRALTNINALADWDLSNVTEMASMFQRCTSLENIDGAKYWNAPKLANISNLFANDAKASGTIQLLSNPSPYGGAFSGAATSSGSEITVNYDCTITANIDAIVATKSSTSHVVKGSCASSSFTVFDTGVEVNIKMKNLANSIATATYSTEDTAIHAIKRSNSLPSGFTPATENTISISSSEYPIYIYFDDTDGTLYYYSEANTVYLNPISANLFYNFKGLTDISGLSSVDSSKVATMTSMFYQCPITNINALASWDTSHVSNMNYMFQNCSSLENINGASNWDTSNVITMQAMFLYDSSLTNINGVSNWDTSNVTNMGNMFTSTSSLTNLDALANWNVSNVSNVGAMFNVCTALEDISGISNWNTSNLDNISGIFSGATKVSGTFPILGNPSSYDSTFYRSATQSGAQVTVKYSCDITTKIDDIIATKSSNSDVVKANECTIVYRQFKIRNKTFGNMASSIKNFNYTVVVRDEDDVIVPEMGTTFTLKNDESEIVDIPDGYKITVEQAAEATYTTTVDNTNNRTITKTIKGDEDIIFKNVYDMSVDTGVRTIIPPYILLMLLSILTLLGIGCLHKKIEAS